MRYANTSVAAAAIFALACTPKQAGEATRAACTLIEAVAEDTTVESVCATAPEVAEIIDWIATSAPDARAKRVAMCARIPTTSVCATNAETLRAIRKVKILRGVR